MTKSILLSIGNADDIFSKKEIYLAMQARILVSELLKAEPKNYISRRYNKY